MTEKVIVAFTGKKQSGKDTAALAAAEFFKARGWSVVITAFADPIRDRVAEIMGCDGWVDENHPVDSKPELKGKKVFDWEFFKKSQGSFAKLGSSMFAGGPFTVSGRDVFRGVGMLMRSYDENQFTRYVSSIYENASDRTAVIVSDLRFDNEAQMIIDNQGLIIRVIRTDETSVDEDTHITERGIDPQFPVVEVVNDRQFSNTVGLFRLSALVGQALSNFMGSK